MQKLRKVYNKDLVFAFQKAVNYIDENLQEEIRLQFTPTPVFAKFLFAKGANCNEISTEKLAEMVSLSPFYFQRLLKRLVNKPVQEYVKLRCLSEAIIKLQTGEQRILDIAFMFTGKIYLSQKGISGMQLMSQSENKHLQLQSHFLLKNII